jgi:hypothetical protein
MMAKILRKFIIVAFGIVFFVAVLPICIIYSTFAMSRAFILAIFGKKEEHGHNHKAKTMFRMQKTNHRFLQN